MADLIARLEGHVATHADCPPSLCAGPYLTKAEAVAILHALKVQQAAEDACQEMTWAEFIGKKWPALVRAVKGEQP